MNKRIRELAEQANITIRSHYDESGSTLLELEKFAELIVQKCAGIIEIQDVDPTFKHRMSWAIRKHFGVLE